ncbi:uncharacterized protein LOC135847459 isoform X3 [Planococcus citri]|uniref:uncharacterized protein LOC135847459 isoform X3 n=1 Tax=Planococcus citri TaxID=170843 RepID=UPI0031F82680
MISDMDDTAQLAVISLKELSGVAVALEIWRSEMKKYRRNDELEKFNPKELSISLQTSFADLRVPTVIDAMIKEYVSIFGLSMENWLEQHYKRVLFFNYGHRNYILYDFDDFVCESNGAIDYVMTAKRVIRCDGLSKAKKFKIACAYFFEDDIRRLWPLVWKKVGLNNINFHDFPQLHYWISCLRNEPNKIPSIELMFNNYMPRNGSSLEYFWNRMPSELHRVKGKRLYRQDVESFARFILPKLNDTHLNEFVNEEGSKLMDYLLRRRELGERIVLQTWLQIKNVMNKQNFRKLVLEMFKVESSRVPRVEGERHLKNFIYLCHEIWYTASDKLKRSVIKKIPFASTSSSCICPNDVNTSSQFLLTVLLRATFEERSSFWHKYWCGLIKSKPVADLQIIMKMCFADDDDEIILYKENVMAKSKHVRNVCVESLSIGLFDELNNFVNFCYPNPDSARNYKQQLLQSSLLGEESVFQLTYLTKAIQFNEFICDAFNDADLATDFKNQLMLSPATLRLLPRVAYSYYFQVNDLVKFVETLISTEQIMKQIKLQMIDNIKEYSIDEKRFIGKLIFESSLEQFLSWCFESDVEAKRFKETYIPRTI